MRVLRARMGEGYSSWHSVINYHNSGGMKFSSLCCSVAADAIIPANWFTCSLTKVSNCTLSELEEQAFSNKCILRPIPRQGVETVYENLLRSREKFIRMHYPIALHSDNLPVFASPDLDLRI